MTAITSPTEVSFTDIPQSRISGTGLRRIKVFIRATSEGTVDTLDLGTLTGQTITTIEIVESSRAGAALTTAHTWSGDTITTAQGAGAYIIEATCHVA